jgi:hypothetical protein
MGPSGILGLSALVQKQIPLCVPRPSRRCGTGKKKRGTTFGMTLAPWMRFLRKLTERRQDCGQAFL